MGYETYRIADLIDEIAMGPFGSNINGLFRRKDENPPSKLP